MNTPTEHNNNPPHTFDDFTCNWDSNELRESVSRVSTPVVTNPATAFLSNVEAVDALQMLPWMVAGEGARLFYWTLKYVGSPGGSKEGRIATANTNLREHMKKNGKIEEFAEVIDRTLKGAMQIESVQHGLQILLRSMVTLMWGAFECLARDLWVALLNDSTTRVKHKALESLDTNGLVDGITSKQIQVGLLARYDFDISRKVGTLLVSKFKFSNVAGMKDAYDAAFGTTPPLHSVFDSTELVILEKYRHLILHKASKIDQKFKDEMACEQDVGEELIADSKTVASLIQNAISAGTQLIVLADGKTE